MKMTIYGYYIEVEYYDDLKSIGLIHMIERDQSRALRIAKYREFGIRASNILN